MDRRDPGRDGDPVHLDLDRQDQELLDQLVASTGLPRAEVIARGIRALAAKLSPLATVRSMEKLIGAFGDAPDAPTDLSERHDVYLGREIA